MKIICGENAAKDTCNVKYLGVKDTSHWEENI